jgi:hypothetical protein
MCSNKVCCIAPMFFRRLIDVPAPPSPQIKEIHDVAAELHQQEVEDPEDAADVLQACFCHREKNSTGPGPGKDDATGHTLICITVTTCNEVPTLFM